VAEKNVLVISAENDPVCVGQNYLYHVRQQKLPIMPLWLDLTNLSPGLGWSNEGRAALLDRGLADVILALALLYLPRVANNVSFSRIVGFFQKVDEFFVPGPTARAEP
jgi:hypothetical protein